MILHARLLLPAAAALALAVWAAPQPAAAAGAPYCLAQSGANGEASYVGNCIYASYQDCLAATAGMRGNCVGNVDYRGEAPVPSARPRRR